MGLQYSLDVRKLGSTTDLLRLGLLTILLTLFSIPLVLSVTSTSDIADRIVWSFSFVVIETMFLAIFVLPLALGIMGLEYSLTKASLERRIENAGYGYIAGFLTGLMILLLMFGAYWGELVGIGIVGFGIGSFLSFISIRAVNAA